MTSLRRSSNPATVRPRRSEQLKDEVYRQMFRLEASRPGAEMELALALLRAWQDADARSEDVEERQWLRKVCPICIEMIEASMQAGGSAPPPVH